MKKLIFCQIELIFLILFEIQGKFSETNKKSIYDWRNKQDLYHMKLCFWHSWIDISRYSNFQPFSVIRNVILFIPNRSITKILGDWWAFLPNEDKFPYKELAKNVSLQWRDYAVNCQQVSQSENCSFTTPNQCRGCHFLSFPSGGH